MYKIFASLILVTVLSACIGDDVVEDYVQPELRFGKLVDTIEVATSYQFTATYFNNIGAEMNVPPEWASSAPEIVSITNTGLATAHAAGSAVITASARESGEETVVTHVVYGGEETVVIEEPTAKEGSIRTTSSYELQGDFTLAESPDGGVILSFADNYSADTGLPGLVVYLTNNPGSNADALEIEAVRVFSGAHSYTIPNVSLTDYSHVLYYCKPFNVKVGDGEIL